MIPLCSLPPTLSLSLSHIYSLVEKTSHHIQGMVRFDENGVREATELRVLQYRIHYINGTLISEGDDSTLSNTTLDQKLRLVNVAYVSGDKNDLEFPDNYSSNDIWPSKYRYQNFQCLILPPPPYS